MGNAKTERNKRRLKRRRLEKKGVDWKYRDNVLSQLNSKIEICSCQ